MFELTPYQQQWLPFAFSFFGAIGLIVLGWIVVFFVREPVVLVWRWLRFVPFVAAFCFFPLIAVQDEKHIPHETAHWHQQKPFMKVGYVGLLLGWMAPYFLLFPIVWNPFRRKWEREAYAADGFTEKQVDRILARPPYLLWL